MVEESSALGALSAGAGGWRRIRPWALAAVSLAVFIGLLVFLAMVVAPWADASGGCGGG